MRKLTAQKCIAGILFAVVLLGTAAGVFRYASESAEEKTSEKTGVWNDGGDIPYTQLYSEEIARYTFAFPPYHPIQRELLFPMEPIFRPDYTLFDDGVYRREIEETGTSALIMLTGDLMCQAGQQTAAIAKYGVYDFRDSFSRVKEILSSADLTVGNLESTLYDKAPYMSEQSRMDGKIYVNGPSSFLGALRDAGFDLLVTANNHCLDTGLPGLFDTLNSLDRYGFMHTGTFTPDADRRFVLVEINGIRLAFVAYSTFFNGRSSLIIPSGQDRFLGRFSFENAKRDINAAREAGAEFVISYMHAGTEYSHRENDNQIHTAQLLADAGADYIVGSHSHSLQKYDTVTSFDGRSVPVVYSMGNFISHQTRLVSKDTAILCLRIEKDADGLRFSDGYIPCHVLEGCAGGSYVIEPILPAADGLPDSLYLHIASRRIAEAFGEKIKMSEVPY